MKKKKEDKKYQFGVQCLGSEFVRPTLPLTTQSLPPHWEGEHCPLRGGLMPSWCHYTHHLITQSQVPRLLQISQKMNFHSKLCLAN